MKSLPIILVMLVFSSTFLSAATAQNYSEMQTFLPSQDLSGDYIGLSVQFNATREVSPNESITVQLQVKCTAEDVNITDFHFDIYAFSHGQEKITLDSIKVMEHEYLPFNVTKQFSYKVDVPSHVWGTTYTKMHLKYTVVDTSVERSPAFLITMIRNVYLEELENQYKNLNNTYSQLNETFWKDFQMPLTNQSLTTLNRTYWELDHNYTALQGKMGQLENTQRAVFVLAITTVFFVAATIYLVTERPKQYW